jgi:hypothetical protein
LIIIFGELCYFSAKNGVFLVYVCGILCKKPPICSLFFYRKYLLNDKTLEPAPVGDVEVDAADGVADAVQEARLDHLVIHTVIGKNYPLVFHI